MSTVSAPSRRALLLTNSGRQTHAIDTAARTVIARKAMFAITIADEEMVRPSAQRFRHEVRMRAKPVIQHDISKQEHTYQPPATDWRAYDNIAASTSIFYRAIYCKKGH